MTGAEFVRVDLHVHTYPDAADVVADPPTIADYVQGAKDKGLAILGITDHNAIKNVREAIDQAAGGGLLVLPGLEISTHEGHLLALFDPDKLPELEAFAHPGNLQLAEVMGSSDLRSNRSILDLVNEIFTRGGLAIPAHVDLGDGIASRMARTALADLLRHPGLAGLEFASRDALEGWFTDGDPDDSRRAAWRGRQQVETLRERGLARVMSSDAHSTDKLGEDRSKRTLTRLKLDEPNFNAVRNAILFNPKARCKAEAILPSSYPRLLRAEFVGGFLDQVDIDFSANLTCLIGGRGSGKSTALLAVRAALGALIPGDESPDEPHRMPDATIVTFLDDTGAERAVRRDRGGEPHDVASGSPVRLKLADLSQDESGRLARGYTDNPDVLNRFLDSFVDLRTAHKVDADLTAELADNATTILRTNAPAEELQAAETELSRLDGNLRAAQNGKVEKLAEWATLLASQTLLLDRLENELSQLATSSESVERIDLDALASEYGADLAVKPASDYVEGTDGLRARLVALHGERESLRTGMAEALKPAAEPSRAILDAWKESHHEMMRRRDAKQAELEAEGLKVQVGAIRELADQLQTAKTKCILLRKKKEEHDTALAQRKGLVSKLIANRSATYERRRATLKRIATSANQHSDDIRVSITYGRAGVRDGWIEWLTNNFGFRTPRVQRLAEKLLPAELAETILRRPADLLAIKDDDGTSFFTQSLIDEAVPKIRTWQAIFALQLMRLDDKPRIVIHEGPGAAPRTFDHLSAGQQRSILLSLLLCADRNEPLILDQPEDHLDARYVAKSVVRHLEAAKERRQVILATHSANLTVLGDAELVIPMYAEAGHGKPREPGAVDRTETRIHVCTLLEGGEDAFIRRGQRYGLDVTKHL